MIVSRYSGLQTILTHLSTDGCYFLSLLSIAEEFLQSKIDLIDTIWIAMGKGYITNDYFVKEPLKLLEQLTRHTWTQAQVTELPEVIEGNEYTVAIYYNKRTGYKHFRRRYFDTLLDSVTVREGSIAYYYIFRVSV